ncbi:MAG: glycosyltransferase family 2 protein [Nitrospirae bacterium]|nr:glycosyltransferase family 2 protein [Nitrospirota bacterium]
MVNQKPVTPESALSLVLPLYNEEDGIREIACGLLKEFKRWAIRCELVLVNNGSTDDTAKILKELAEEYRTISVVHVPENFGYGWGILCGLRVTTSPIVGFMCGDGQIVPEDVARVYRRLIEENLDIAKVVRVVRADGFQRKVMSNVYNGMFRVLFHITSRDINGTPKLMRRQCYEELSLESKDWFIDAEVMIKAANGRYRIGEVPVEFRPRVNGRSQVRLRTAFEFLRNMVRYRFVRE